MSAGYFAGQQYARRISPSWDRQSGELFKKGNDATNYAARLAIANQWNEAADVWQNHINSQNPKLAGADCFNSALASEINGDLEKDTKWAEKTFTCCNINKVLKNSYILKNRVARQHILENSR